MDSCHEARRLSLGGPFEESSRIFYDVSLLERAQGMMCGICNDINEK